MSNKAHAKKAQLQSIKHAKRNKRVKDSLKSLVKKSRYAIQEKRLDDASKLVKDSTKALAMAAQKGIIKKNTASRKISRITKMLNKSR
ncbi:MAG TPA: 30S ribosomal protein S20 [Patescibacteria group bacterium]|nr:30S ribosomal protein S20 [Patescibacteria group bacterium]